MHYARRHSIRRERIRQQEAERGMPEGWASLSIGMRMSVDARSEAGRAEQVRNALAVQRMTIEWLMEEDAEAGVATPTRRHGPRREFEVTQFTADTWWAESDEEWYQRNGWSGASPPASDSSETETTDE